MYSSHARRRHLGAVSGALALATLLTLAAAARAGSLQDFLDVRPPTRHTVEESLTRINDFTAALEADLADHQLTIAQRKTALYERAVDWMNLIRCKDALPDFTALIDGTDPRIGPLPETDPLYTASLRSRAVCRYVLFDLDGAKADIGAARALNPNDFSLRRMDMEMMLSDRPMQG